MEKHKTLSLLITIVLGIMIIFNFSCKKTDNNPGEGITVTDIEGNVYKTVTIGNQLWMAENLKTTRYNDGTDIPLLKGGSVPDTLNGKPVGYRIHYNSRDDISEYGEHYNWYAVSSQHLCPDGWHVPDTSEWMVLFNYLGGIKEAGGKMKSIYGWAEPNRGATNSSGFNGLPAGTYIPLLDEIRYVDTLGGWWTIVPRNNKNAYGFALNFNAAYILGGSSDKEIGISIRCIKN